MTAKKKVVKDENSKIKEEIIKEIQPKLQESFSSLKKDLLFDIKELIEKKNLPEPEKETTSPKSSLDLSSVMNALSGKDGNMDMSKISSLMSQVPSSQPPMDLDNLSEGQIKFMQQEQQNKLLMMILPQILGQQQSNPMTDLFTQFMQRNFLETIVDSTLQRKIIQNSLMKKMGADISQVDLGLMKPVNDAVTKLSSEGAVSTGQS